MSIPVLCLYINKLFLKVNLPEISKKCRKPGMISSPPKILDEFTHRHYLETKARSILNKATPDILPGSLFKPTAYKSGFEFASQSQKNRYMKIVKELQIMKTKLVTNPMNKMDTAKGFLLLHTRFNPSEEQIEKFISFLMEDRVIPSNMNFTDTLFYMMTYEKNFDLAQTDGYRVKQENSSSLSMLKNAPQLKERAGLNTHQQSDSYFKSRNGFITSLERKPQRKLLATLGSPRHQLSGSPLREFQKYQKFKTIDKDDEIEKYMGEYIGTRGSLTNRPSARTNPSNFTHLQKNPSNTSCLSEKPQEIWEMVTQDHIPHTKVDKISQQKLVLEYIIQSRSKAKAQKKQLIEDRNTILSTD